MSASDAISGAGLSARKVVAVPVVGAFAFLAVFWIVAASPGSASAASNLEILLASASGACAFALVQAAVAVDALALMMGLDSLRALRPPAIAAAFWIALVHGAIVLFAYHGGGVINPVVSLFVSDARYDGLSAFPFEILGLGALPVLAAGAIRRLARYAATAYAAYALAAMHVLLGPANGSALYQWVVLAGFVFLALLFCAAFAVRLGGLTWRAGPAAAGSMVAVLLVAFLALDAWTVARLQPAAGTGRISDAAYEFSGTLVRQPYPMLRVASGEAVKTYLLAADDKRGADAILGVTPNGPVKLAGRVVSRAGMSLVELARDDVAVISEVAVLDEPAREVHGGATLEGAIVDARSWLGAMRPAEGRVYKGSASLSLRGGVPPLFVTAAGGVRRAMLLAQADGSAVPPDLIVAYAADPVRLSGTIEKRADLWVFRADFSSLMRLD